MHFISIFCIVISYCIGAIPFGLLLSRRTGIDIRQEGSKNIGATNVTRLLGKKMGFFTLVLDMLKGYGPMCVASWILGGVQGNEITIALCGAASILGHMFPVYLHFKGGKGVATALGAFLYLAPWAVLGCLAVFLGCVAFSGYVSLGSLFGALSILLWLVIGNVADWKIILALFIVTMIWIKHFQNIRRLLDGTEKSWKKKAEA